MTILHSSASVCWYTPVDIIERARTTLGHFDLDPATDEFGNSRVKAASFMTEKGLEAEWSGLVFLNPPGGRGSAKRWWNKLRESKAEAAIFVGFSMQILQTEQSILEHDFCIPKRRIHFEKPDGLPNSPTHGNVIVLYQRLRD